MGQKSRWTLPRIVHPQKYRRFVICVPDEQFYIAAFQGLLIELTYSKNWQRDVDHTAAVVSRVWQHALEDVLCDTCGTPVLIDESDYEMSLCEQLRFNTTTHKLQALCCGEWVNISGQGADVPGGGDQPGGGTEQPGVGGCQTYHGKLNANGQWYLPTVVSAGDTIQLDNVRGAGYDGTVSPWHCPNGDTFFGGACVGGTGGPAGGDPAAAANHMEIVLHVSGVWYRPLNGAITVPGGVSLADAYLQVNDSALSDNAGSYTFDVIVCNNQTPVWCHYFDFALDTYGFSVVVPGSQVSGDSGHWVAGTGFVYGDSVQSGPFYFRRVVIQRAGITPFDITKMDILGDLTKGPFTNGGDLGIEGAVVASAVATDLVLHANPAISDGNGQTWSGASNVSGVDTLFALICCSATGPANSTSGNAVIKGLRVYGTGANPFSTSNC